MSHRAVVVVAALALLAIAGGCADWWVVAYGTGDCWYDAQGNLYCGDGFYAGGVYSTTASGRVLASHEVLRLVNDERTAAGLEPLSLDEAVARVAYEHAVDLDVGEGEPLGAPPTATISDRLRERGLESPRMEGATFVGDVPPEAVVEQWMADPALRAVLLDPRMEAAGIGVHSVEGMCWWAGVFVGA
jgi:uncharacterized protein YkwD